MIVPASIFESTSAEMVKALSTNAFNSLLMACILPLSSSRTVLSAACHIVLNWEFAVTASRAFVILALGLAQRHFDPHSAHQLRRRLYAAIVHAQLMRVT